MKAPKIVQAMGHIDEDLLLDAMEEPSKVRKTAVRIRRFASAAAVLVLMVTIGGFFAWRSQGNMTNPLAAYALDYEGNLTPFYMDTHESVSLTEIELEIGLKGFLFSCTLEDPNADSELHMLNLSTTPTPSGVEQMYSILEDKGQCYFYFIPPENDDPPYKITCRGDRGDGQIMTYELVIELTGEEYTGMVVDRSIEYTGVDHTFHFSKSLKLDAL